MGSAYYVAPRSICPRLQPPRSRDSEVRARRDEINREAEWVESHEVLLTPEETRGRRGFLMALRIPSSRQRSKTRSVESCATSRVMRKLVFGQHAFTWGSRRQGAQAPGR